MSLKEAFAHHRYLFRQMEKVRPSFCAFALFVAIATGTMGFVTNILLLRHALNSVQQQLPFAHIVAVFGLCLLIDLLVKSMRYAYQVWRVPLMAHDMHHHFAHLHIKNVTIKHLIEEATDVYELLFRGAVACVANAILLTWIDPILLIFALVPLVALPLHVKQRTLRVRLQDERHDLQAKVRRGDYSLKNYRESCGDILRMLKKDGWSLAGIGYAVALVTEVLLEIGGMLYAVYRTSQGDFEYGDCFIVVTAIGSLSNTLLHFPELLLRVRRHGSDVARFRALTERGDAS